MSRNLSVNFRRAAFASETGVFPIMLFTIQHPSLTEPIRISTDPTERIRETTTDIIYGTRSRGMEFIFFPIRFTLPAMTDDGPQQMKLEIDNIHREFTTVIRSISGPPSVNVEMILNNTPDVVEAMWPEFLLINATIDAFTISGTLALETLVREPFPAGYFDPSRFPGLF